MGLSIWQLLLILIVVFTLFGAGKLPRVMGDIGRGMRSLREGLKGEGDQGKDTPSNPKTIDHTDKP